MKQGLFASSIDQGGGKRRALFDRPTIEANLGRPNTKLLPPKLPASVGRCFSEPELNVFNVLYCLFDVFHIQHGGK
jgi:hypothetical protein